MIFRMQVAGLCAAASLLLVPVARADETATGTVAQVFIVGGLGAAPGNADMRVYLTGNVPFCTGATLATNWAFLNLSDPNYKAMLAMLLTAQVSGKQVTAVSRPAALGSGTYCQLVYAYMSN